MKKGLGLDVSLMMNIERLIVKVEVHFFSQVRTTQHPTDKLIALDCLGCRRIIDDAH